MEKESINSETVNNLYSGHQFRQQEGPKALLMNVAGRLSLNPEVYCKLPCNVDGRTLTQGQSNFFNKKQTKMLNCRLFDFIIEMWNVCNFFNQKLYAFIRKIHL